MANLAELPTELFDEIRYDDVLSDEDIISLSCVCKRFRKLCVPSIFDSVRFSCSKFGLENLRDWAKSELRHHAIFFAYWIPPFLDPKALTLENFTFTFSDSEDANGTRRSREEWHDIFHKHNKDTQEIIKSGTDLTVLSSALKALPFQGSVRFDFRNEIQDHHGHILKIPHRIQDSSSLKSQAYAHHIPVLASALSHARAAGQHFVFLRLVGMSVVGGDGDWPSSEETRDMLRQSLKQMFGDVDTVILSRSRTVLRLCTAYPLHIRDVEIQNMSILRSYVEDFLSSNVASLHRIGIFNLHSPWSPTNSMKEITARDVLELLNTRLYQISGIRWELEPEDGLVPRMVRSTLLSLE
ncbi:uncharacterized protein DSM5745_00470 [Aspergillus mulundensis]|uniref:F-box domain-containing protein n=1 Tax=Aspergillus mulundensis TaxID=1810919 RepID=A0A3D8T563_9EURO|nr:hypothetical protein DSM5745_00470 [Aspergillus mulundensis]RDW93148.1 hypothetical protein DSM5745_00470 [Aspergillus mulundensis]